MGAAVSKGVHPARPPYGFRAVRLGPQVDHWEHVPGEVEVVRLMWGLAVTDNLGYKGISDRLNGQGYRTRTRGLFKAYSVAVILCNEALAGTLTYGKRPRKGNPQGEIVRVEGFFPPIFSQAEWQRLQERRAIRRESAKGQTHRSQYLLSGMAKCGHCGGPMSGKVGAMGPKGIRYKNYWCSRSLRAKGACEVGYNGHSARKLEKAVLDYLGQFSDPQKVREFLAASDRRDAERAEAELATTEHRLAELSAQLLRDVDRLDRHLLTEAEFVAVSEARRSEIGRLEGQKATLTTKVTEERSKAATAGALPAKIGSFLEDFQAMPITQAKAQLQRILRAVHVFRDNRIELEFRP